MVPNTLKCLPAVGNGYMSFVVVLFFAQVDITAAEEGLQEEVGADGCL